MTTQEPNRPSRSRRLQPLSVPYRKQVSGSRWWKDPSGSPPNHILPPDNRRGRDPELTRGGLTDTTGADTTIGVEPDKVIRSAHLPGGPGFEERRLDTADWPNAIAMIEGPQLVVAGPGAGKTEFLVRRVAHLFDERRLPGAGILALTFSRRAAADLRARINVATGKPLGGLSASTFHSFAYRLLELHAPDTLGWTEMPSIPHRPGTGGPGLRVAGGRSGPTLARPVRESIAYQDPGRRSH